MTIFIELFKKDLIPLIIFLCLFVFDFILGLCKGIFIEGVSSAKLRLSVPKFLAYCGVTFATVLLDTLIVTSTHFEYSPLSVISTIYFCIVEIKSILENAKTLGVDVPKSLQKTVDDMSDKMSSSDEQKGAKATTKYTWKQWTKSVLGKKWDMDGVSGVQCVDLIHHYLKYCFGIPVTARGNARDYWNAYDNDSNLKKYFTKIKNTPDLVLQIGDVVIWDYAPYGHIAVATGEGSLSYFQSIDQNYGKKQGQYVTHNFDGVRGVLRPKSLKSLLGQPDNFKAGTYTLTENIGVYSIDKNGDSKIKKVNQLTADGRKHATKTSGNAYLKKGTKVTISEFVRDKKGSLWGLIPSGYIVVWHVNLKRNRIK